MISAGSGTQGLSRVVRYQALRGLEQMVDGLEGESWTKKVVGAMDTPWLVCRWKVGW